MQEINKKELLQQLNSIKHSLTSEEWLIFTLIYHEELTIQEVALVLDKEDIYVMSVLDKVMLKATPILGTNILLLGNHNIKTNNQIAMA